MLASKQGDILVQGHTDNIPISTARFRSNWDLSTARAVSVAHELFTGGILNQKRFQVAGFADTRPLVENSNRAGRARNRRVEIVIQQGWGAEMKEDLNVLRREDPEAFKALELEIGDQFDLNAGDIF